MTVLVYSDDAAGRGELGGAAGPASESVAFDASPLPDQDTATIALALAAAAKEVQADLVLVSATKRGKDIGARLAGHLDWPFASEIQAIARDGASWIVDRMVLSGNSRATYTLGPKAVCTATPKTFAAAAEPTRKVAAPKTPASRVQVVERQAVKHSEFDLSSAPVVIGVGRGFKAQKDIQLAEALAACFKGGAVGCSRPIAADLKWLGEEHWIGLSGHAIKPKAYIACGVSGQIQHVAGIRGAKLIVAVNTNKDAPIFQVSDYGVVGDLYQVIPQLCKLLGH
ncbi:MAG: electron transfer flavoprotein subunit alpha/FixB family protein [Thermoplasmatota archaeon]